MHQEVEFEFLIFLRSKNARLDCSTLSNQYHSIYLLIEWCPGKFLKFVAVNENVEAIFGALYRPP